MAPFVERLLDEDDFKKVIDGRAVQHVLRTHQAPLAAIFGSFARSGRMNLEQWQAMIKDGNLLDKFFTSRESVLIFVRVNLKDDLYRGDSDFDAEMTVGLPEFLRLVARLVREVQRSRGAETVETFASTLESFLSLRLVPKFRAVLKPRGVTVPVVTAEDEEGKGESESESDEGGDGKQTEAGDGAARK